MKITKGTILNIKSVRKGDFEGIASEDFDTNDEWYHVKVNQKESISGLSTIWHYGDEIPCRKGIEYIMFECDVCHKYKKEIEFSSIGDIGKYCKLCIQEIEESDDNYCCEECDPNRRDDDESDPNRRDDEE